MAECAQGDQLELGISGLHVGTPNRDPINGTDASAGLDSHKQIVTAFEVDGGYDARGRPRPIDYSRISDEFGTQPMSHDLVQRIEKVTGKPVHHYFRKNIVLSHRDLEKVLDMFEAGVPFYVYTGRGPSSESMHLGHVIPFTLTKWLQDTFGAFVIIQLTDDEKYLYRGQAAQDPEYFKHLAMSNAKDIIACGFDVSKTFIFSDFEHMGGRFYETAIRVARCMSNTAVRKTFGFDETTNIGTMFFPAVQATPSFACAFPEIFGARTTNVPCLIPCAIDQDPYFRLTRDAAPRLGLLKPSLLHCKFLPALQGLHKKMSASATTSVIYLTDDMDVVANKVRNYAFSSGAATIAEHRRVGGDPDTDMAFAYLSYFLDDDVKLQKFRELYRRGDMLSGELKDQCICVLQAYLRDFQARRRAVADSDVLAFMTPKRSAEAAVPPQYL